MFTRLITFAGTTLSIEYYGNRPAKILDFLYGYIPADGSDVSQVNYRLLPHSQGGADQLALYRDDKLLRQSDDEAAIADHLLGNSCYNLAYHSRGGLLFHAAGLARQGKGLLLPGTMGVGKSTLTAWLLGRDFDYLTDELVFMPQDSLTMKTFPRPLNLKRTSRTVLSRQLDFAEESAHFLSSTTTDLVPAPLFNPNSIFSAPPLGLIIFPNYQAASDFVLKPLSKAQAGLALMQCLVNARNLSDHGFSEITRLARAVPAYKLSYASFDQIGDCIESLLEEL